MGDPKKAHVAFVPLTKYPNCSNNGTRYCSVNVRKQIRGEKTGLTNKQLKRIGLLQNDNSRNKILASDKGGGQSMPESRQDGSNLHKIY